jgi:hypothetical protein
MNCIEHKRKGRERKREVDKRGGKGKKGGEKGVGRKEG